MGRPESDVQRCFSKLRAVGGAVTCVCLGCGKTVSNVCSRLRTHVGKCAALQQSGMWQASKPLQKEGDQSLRAAWQRPQQDVVNRALARCMYSTNLPFRWVASPAVKALVQCLSPGTKVAGRRQFAGKLLAQEYTSEVERLRKVTEGGHYTLSIDGWSTVDNAPLLGFGLCSRLVCIVEERKERHTAQWLSDTASSQIALLEKVYACSIVAVCSDGASNMEGVNFLTSHHRSSALPSFRNAQPTPGSTPQLNDLQMSGTCNEPGGTRFF